MRNILLLISLCLLFTSFAAGQKRVVNSQFGFSMQEPKGWHSASKTVLKDNLNKFEWTDEERDRMLKEGGQSIHIAAFHKYDPRTIRGLIPTIQIVVRPNGTKDFQSFKKGLAANFPKLSQMFENFSIIRGPEDVEISGVRSDLTVFSFTMKTADGQLLKVRSRSYAIPYGKYFFQMNFTDSMVGEDCSAEFDQLVKTITIGKP